MSWIIRDTTTGAQFSADNGRSVWHTSGGAKVSWRQSGYTLKNLGVIAATWEDPGSFNSQTRFVMEEQFSKATLAKIAAPKKVYIVKGDAEVGIEKCAFRSKEAAEQAYKDAWMEIEGSLDDLAWFEVIEFQVQD